MRRLLLTAAVLIATGTLALGDVVTDWNNVLLQAIRTGSTNPPRASRTMAMVHSAIYDSVNSVDDTHYPYLVNFSVAAGTSREAAAAQAAHDVLSSVYPAQQATFTTALNNSLSAIANGQAKTDGIQLGSNVAAGILALRSGDHSNDVIPFTPGGMPGQWAPTPTANLPALLPNWPTVTPWCMTSGSQFRHAVGPPAIGTPEYATALNEVKAIGSATSATRSDDQTHIARFWADGGGTSTPPGHWNRIAQTVAALENNTLSENARLFALLNIAEADAAVVSWDNKYHTNYWRPVTAIRQADTDGNAATDPDPNWSSLITTPPFPTYTSGHSTFSGAAAEILRQFYGTDNIAFTSSAEGFAVADRSFTSFSQAASEAADSRLFGGIHFRFDNEHGLANGTALGQFVFANELQVIPEPSTVAMSATALAVLCFAVGRRRKLR